MPRHLFPGTNAATTFSVTESAPHFGAMARIRRRERTSRRRACARHLKFPCEIESLAGMRSRLVVACGCDEVRRHNVESVGGIVHVMKCATQRKRIRRVPERRIRITGAE